MPVRFKTQTGVNDMAIGLPTGYEPDATLPPGKTPRLLLHCCCAPCGGYVLEYLSPFFEITVLFYNPNIHTLEEYNKRAAELQKLTALAEYTNSVDIIISDYDSAEFETIAAPYWDDAEGGRRCRVCFELRLDKTARSAKQGGFDVFATTLSVSPHKNSAMLNEVGSILAEESGVKYLSADFKKQAGYMRSIELSKKYDLYRQRYCGCAPSTKRANAFGVPEDNA